MLDANWRSNQGGHDIGAIWHSATKAENAYTFSEPLQVEMRRPGRLSSVGSCLLGV